MTIFSILTDNASPNQQVFIYNYALLPTSLKWPFASLGAFHSSELLYLFRRDADMHAPERVSYCRPLWHILS